MKHINLVQSALLIVALLLGYNALQTMVYVLWLLYQWIEEGLTLALSFSNIAVNFLYLAFYILGTIILIKRSKGLSEKITEESGLSPAISGLLLNKTDVLQVTLLAMGIYILMTRLPKLFVKAYVAMQEAKQPLSYDGPNFVLPTESLPEFIIASGLAIILIVYARTFAEYLSGYTPDAEIPGEIETQNKTNT